MADFQEHFGKFRDENIGLAAGSVDSKKETGKFAADIGVEFEMVCGMDCEASARTLGCYYESEKKYLQPTGFLINPDGSLLVGCYSSGPVGRLAARNVLDLIKYYKKKD